MDSSIIGQLIIYMVVLVFAISAHECAHAWMSYRFGDDTARLLGRITLNPVAHTDPIGTLLIPIMGFIFGHMGGVVATIPLIGWGKPTPVNPLRWRNKNVANVMVSIAGILANLIIAICAFTVFKVMIKTNGFSNMNESLAEPLSLFLRYSLLMNVSLAIFNLLPFPPLDGSKVLQTFLPESMQPALSVLEQYGFLILIVLLYMGFFSIIMRPVVMVISYLLYL
ncbi:MAG: site-2 protease family protein [Pyrinomonadaceae bacterium]|nr:site-2 protease family protein [Pyrinomonadaceae bacterium]